MSYYYYNRSRPKRRSRPASERTRHKFGQTWWGENWLKSLSNIDFDNRLPRGRTYANNGSVLNVDIQGSRITSKVQGSRQSPYSVKISVPVPDKKKVKTLLAGIRENPNILAHLLNRELDPEFNELALQNGIQLFPRSWHDLDMKCSCPDWAVPCKHIAAVIYLISAEIDKNPFILLNMRGFTLEDLIGKQLPESSAIMDVPCITTLLNKGTNEGNARDAHEFLRPDLSKIPGKNDSLLDLLKPSPLFCAKDFKSQLIKAYRIIPAFVADIRDSDWEEHRHPSLKFPLKLVIDKKDHFIRTVLMEDRGKASAVSLAGLMAQLFSTGERELVVCHEHWRWLHAAMLFAFRLMETGAFHPAIWKNEKGLYFIRWMPAIQIAEVAKIAEILEAGMPVDLMYVSDFSAKKINPVRLEFSSRETFYQLCHSFIQLSIYSAYSQKKFPAEWYNNDIPKELQYLFGACASVGFEGFGKAEIPAAVYQWLSVFSIPGRKFKPHVQVLEVKRGFDLQILLRNSDEPLSPYLKLSEIHKKSFAASDRMDILKDLRMLASQFSVLTRLLKDKDMKATPVDLDELGLLLRDMAPRMALMGVDLLLPKSLSSLIRPGLKLRIRTTNTAKPGSFFSLTDILEYQWNIAIGDTDMSPETFFKLARSASGLVNIKDRYILLNEAELRSLREKYEARGKMNPHQLLQAVISGQTAEGEAGLDANVVKMIRTMMKPAALKIPKGLKAELRPYQERGFQWLAHNQRLGMGSILADDMGLGKTIQTLSWLLHCYHTGQLSNQKALIVMPTSLLTNWQKEIERFTPQLKSVIYHGTDRRNDFRDAQIILTSYGIVRRDHSRLDKLPLHALIIDEAQNIKNPDSDQSKAVKKLHAPVRVALSGTPVENNLIEYWSIFDFVNPGYLGSRKHFQETFAKPIHLHNDRARIEYFRKVTAPFILRRLKTDKSIIDDLPDKIEANQYTALSPVQAALYQSIVNKALEEIAASEGIQRKALILTMMMTLKQVGNHPSQYLKSGAVKGEDSGKLLFTRQIIENILEANEKVLIFTQFKEMGMILKHYLESELKEEILFLHGGSSRTQRDAMVTEFQQGKSTRIFILSLKAGGTGLNLTAACNVIHYDLWWNPAVETQASDRAYRIGQRSNVMIYRMINRGTIEEKIDLMIRQKRDLANLTVATGETWLGNLSNEELEALVQLDGNQG